MSHQKELNLLRKYIQSCHSVKDESSALEVKFSSVPKRYLNPQLKELKRNDQRLKVSSHICTLTTDWLPLEQSTYSQVPFLMINGKNSLEVIKWKTLQPLKASDNDKIDFWIALLIQLTIFRGRCVSRCPYIHFKIMFSSVK